MQRVEEYCLEIQCQFEICGMTRIKKGGCSCELEGIGLNRRIREAARVLVLHRGDNAQLEDARWKHTESAWMHATNVMDTLSEHVDAHNKHNRHAHEV